MGDLNFYHGRTEIPRSATNARGVETRWLSQSAKKRSLCRAPCVYMLVIYETRFLSLARIGCRAVRFQTINYTTANIVRLNSSQFDSAFVTTRVTTRDPFLFSPRKSTWDVDESVILRRKRAFLSAFQPLVLLASRTLGGFLDWWRPQMIYGLSAR